MLTTPLLLHHHRSRAAAHCLGQQDNMTAARMTPRRPCLLRTRRKQQWLIVPFRGPNSEGVPYKPNSRRHLQAFQRRGMWLFRVSSAARWPSSGRGDVTLPVHPLSARRPTLRRGSAGPGVVVGPKPGRTECGRSGQQGVSKSPRGVGQAMGRQDGCQSDTPRSRARP